jgi:hypothetical protein
MEKLKEIIDRPNQHWMEDGVVELMLGLTFFLTGAVWWFERTLPRSSSFGMAPPLPWMIIILACWWGRNILKERVIAPRAGYVTLRDTTDGGVGPFKSRLLVRMLWFVFFAVIFRIAHRWTPERWTWVTGDIWMAVIGICMVGSALHYKAPRYLWLAGLSFAVAGWMYLTHAPIEKMDIAMTWLGAGFALLGAIQLRDFLATHPRVEDHG